MKEKDLKVDAVTKRQRLEMLMFSAAATLVTTLLTFDPNIQQPKLPPYKGD